MDLWTAFNNRLTFTIYWKMRAMAIVSSKLPNCCYYYHIFAISYKNTAFNWRSKYETIFTIINIYIGCHIKDKICTIFAFINIKLLPFQWINKFDFELVLLLLKWVISRVEFFLFHTSIQDIIFWFWFLLRYFLLFWYLLL